MGPGCRYFFDFACFVMNRQLYIPRRSFCPVTACWGPGASFRDVHTFSDELGNISLSGFQLEKHIQLQTIIQIQWFGVCVCDVDVGNLVLRCLQSHRPTQALSTLLSTQAVLSATNVFDPSYQILNYLSYLSSICFQASGATTTEERAMWCELKRLIFPQMLFSTTFHPNIIFPPLDLHIT